MPSPTHSEIHSDHRHWKSEIAMWREDILQWEKEAEVARTELEAAIGQHRASLKDHAKSVGSHHGEVIEHKRFIAECDRSAAPKVGDEDRAQTENHRDEAAKQAALRDVHERIKKRHHTAVSKLAVLAGMLERHP